MKHYFLLLPLLAIFLSACEKDDSDAELGYTNIYMPQALSSGVNLNYAVPAGKDSASYNYKIDATRNKVKVLLGVARTGKIALSEYTVTVTTNADTVNTLLTSKVLDASTVLLPAALYTLPASVTVPAGQNSASFYLEIDRTQLKAAYTGKKVALAVVLTSPSKYALNTAANKAIVIINVDALKL